MKTPVFFNAPWGKPLKWVTVFSVIICVGISLWGIFATPPPVSATRFFAIAVPLLVPIGGTFFMIRGYTLADRTLLIQRLGWNSRVDLEGLTSAVSDPAAMKGSLRTFGNGGLFSICGWFYSRKLGAYRAFATDMNHSVVLRFPKRTVVVTPENPDEFARAVTDFR